MKKWKTAAFALLLSPRLDEVTVEVVWRNASTRKEKNIEKNFNFNMNMAVKQSYIV